jgi:hypothetical protein
MKRVLLLLCVLLWVFSASSQELPDSAKLMAEMEDSISSLYIKPIRKPEKLLKRIIQRLQYDLQQKHEVGKFRVDANFSQDTLTPFSASCVVSAEAGVGLDKVEVETFNYEGPYELTSTDSIDIKHFLLQFATLSPVHAHKAHWETYKAKSSLVNYKETMKCYNVTADSIADGSGRSVIRFRFNWKKKQGADFDWEQYNGEIIGIAYFDSRTLQLKRFKGGAYLPSLKYITRLYFQNDYEEKGKTPVLKQINVSGTKSDMEMKATVQRAM